MHKLPDKGLVLGREPPDGDMKIPAGFRAGHSPRSTKAGAFVADNSQNHALIIAPTGQGKKRNILAATLLSSRQPVIVLDLKGELALETASHRQKVLGQKVFVLDPFEVNGPQTAFFNPIDIIDPDSPTFEDDCQVMAEMLAPPEVRNDPFWDESAKMLTAGFVAHVATHPSIAERSFGKIAEMASGQDITYELAVLLDTQSLHPFAHSKFAGFLNISAEQTRGGIIATWLAHLRVLSGRSVRKAISKTSFDLRDIRDGKPISLYIVVPPDKLSSHAALIRLWVLALLKLYTSRKSAPRMPTLFLLDEVAQLGGMRELVSLVTLARGYGVRCALFFQSLGQLRSAFPREHVQIADNCGVIAAFGVNRQPMATEVSALLGDISADALMAMSSNELALSQQGQPTRIIRRADYVLDPELSNLASPNPMIRS